MRRDRQIAACNSTNLSEEAIPSGALPSLGILQSQEDYHYIFFNSNKTCQVWLDKSDLPGTVRHKVYNFSCKKSIKLETV